jgi:hypothetical protein
MADVVVTEVGVNTLHTDPINPRRINEREMERLRRSIREDPDFMRLRPILARPDGSIYAGNMRYEAAKAEGWLTVPAIITNDPEAIVRKRAVKDNTQFGEWVDEELAEYLHDLSQMDPDIDVGALGLPDNLLAELGTVDVDLGQFLDAHPGEDPPSAGGMANPAGHMDHDMMETMPTDDRTETMLNAAADMVYDWTKGEADPRYNIPVYRTDRLLAKLPEPLTVWAGSDAHQDDPFYLYNYSPNGTWTDVPLERCLFTFFTDDRFLIRWIANPAYYVTRILKANVRMACEVDFSPYQAMPFIIQAFQVYRSRWLARFMQDAGIEVVPRLPYPDPGDTHYNELIMLGMPKHVPVMAYNAQTGGNDDPDTLSEVGKGVTWYLKEGPTVGQLLVYGEKTWPQQGVEVPGDTEVVALPSYLTMRSRLGLPWRAN